MPMVMVFGKQQFLFTDGTSGNYIFLNSPSNGGDWGAKEDLSGLPCADPANWNDRILPAVTADVTIPYCFWNL